MREEKSTVRFREQGGSTGAKARFRIDWFVEK